VHEEKVEDTKESLELVYPWRANSRANWNISGVFWSWKLKNQVVRPEE
jgi:hypothetical protein